MAGVFLLVCQISASPEIIGLFIIVTSLVKATYHYCLLYTSWMATRLEMMRAR